MSWGKNPTSFKFKSSLDSNSNTISINEAKEFGISNIHKFVKRTVDIDQTYRYSKKISNNKNPDYIGETVFLKVLIEGEASLYEFRRQTHTQYFFSLDNNQVVSLIFKEYSEDGNKILLNNEYKKQLYDNFYCSSLSIDETRDIKYNKKDLSQFLENYNNCVKSVFVNYDKNKTVQGERFRIHLRGGLDFNNLDIKLARRPTDVKRNASLDNQTNIRLGILFEYVLPFWNNKWALILEPTYQSYKGETIIDATLPFSSVERSFLVEADLKTIELAFGLRHYLYINNKLNFNITIGALADFDLSSSISYEGLESPSFDLEFTDMRPGLNFFAGFGILINQKYSLEFNLQSSQDILVNEIGYYTDYETYSIIFGYRFL